MIVCIPSIGKSPYLADLLEVLEAEPCVKHVQLIDNVDGEARKFILSHHTKVHLMLKPGDSIYDAWNRGIMASTMLSQNVAILNDDIILKPGSLFCAEQALIESGYDLMGLNYLDPDADPNPNAGVRTVHGTFRTLGFGGFAFVLRYGAPLVDGRFKWWCGDDDLAERIKARGGRMGVALGAPVDHPSPSHTGSQESWTYLSQGVDLTLFRELWPDAP